MQAILAWMIQAYVTRGEMVYSTHIGNESFAYFKSSGSKSRLNFLRILRGAHAGYYINDHSIKYLEAAGFPYEKILLFKRVCGRRFSNDSEWQECLKCFCISGFRHIRTATEAAIVGWLATHYKKELFIVSDEAGQFRVFRHGLCWIHTERKLSSLIPSSDEQIKLQEQALDHFWQFYRMLKQYKASPNYKRKKHLKYLFSKLFTQETRWPDLNKANDRVCFEAFL